jgi:DNA repair protein RadA/Sms
VAQVRECAAQLTRLAKQAGLTMILVGHVTKEGALAGPRVLEHMVDTVLYFEGDTQSSFRLVRAFKNRYGAVNELGVFAMTDRGLKGVSNPSALFLSSHDAQVAGSCVMATQEGTRPLLVEIQALVDSAHVPNPRRLSVGLEQQRLAMLLGGAAPACRYRHVRPGCIRQRRRRRAHRRAGRRSCGAAGGRLVDARQAAAARASSCSVKIGLAGEVRPAPRGQERLREAAKLGFSSALVPRANAPKQPIEGHADHRGRAIGAGARARARLGPVHTMNAGAKARWRSQG